MSRERSREERERRERAIKVNKMRRFALSAAGQKKMRIIAPDLVDTIVAHPDYLEIEQIKDDSRVAGLYMNTIYGVPFYTGESGNVFWREIEHIYDYITSSEWYGGKYDAKVPARFTVYALGVQDKALRESMERKAIKVTHPVLQWTDPNAPEYGKDKYLPEGETRESIRPDICVFPYLRKIRYEEVKKAYENGTLTNVLNVVPARR